MKRSLARAKGLHRLAFDRLEPRVVMSHFFVATTGSDSNPGTAASPLQTIQEAANLVSAGDTVTVEPGDYAGFVLGWDTPTNGTAGRPIVFEAEPGAIINSRDNETPDGIDLEGSSYITIEGFTVTGVARAGIRAVEDTNVIIRDNVTDSNGDWSIYTSHSDDVIIDSNVASRSKLQHGIYVANACVNPTVTDNDVWGNANCGIHLNGDAGEGGDGLIVNALIEGNIIHDNGATGGSAINLDGVEDSMILNNLLYNNHSSGVALFQGDGAEPSMNNLVASNTIEMAYDARWAININGGATGNQLFDNILLDDNTARGAVTITSDSLAGFLSDNNVGSKFEVDDTTMSLAAWQADTGQDLHSLSATAASLFRDAAHGNFHLAARSPALAAGKVMTQYSTDIEGRARPENGPWDIGAFQDSAPVRRPPTTRTPGK